MSPVQPSNASAAGRTPRASRLLPILGTGLLLALTACGGGKIGAIASPPPVFTTQPADVTVVAGSTGSFTASASGSPTYQWVRSGVAISGASSASYTTPATTPADNNGVFSVTAQNSAGAVNSAFATLHVNYATITTNPIDVAVASGQKATLTVAASGSGTLAYQWTKAGSPISGATTATYSIAAAGLTDSAPYACTVTSSLNGTTATATSTVGHLAVLTAAPAITMQPVDLTVVNGSPATFSVVADNALSYQWFKSDGKNNLPLAGATAATLAIASSNGGDDNAAFTVAVTNPAGTTISVPAKLHVNYLRVATQPQGAVVAEGGAFTLSPTLATSGAVTYQWSKVGAGAIPGATSATYALPSVALADAGIYSCAYVSTLNGTTVTGVSDPAQLQVVGRPQINGQPVGGTYIVGNPLTLKVDATQVGSGNMAYQWYLGTTPLHDVLAATGVTAVTGSQLASLYIQSLASTDTGDYTCKITNTYRGVAATATSQTVHLQVNGSPVITVQPASTTVNAGRPASFIVTAQGPGTLTYKWFRGATAIDNSNSPTYTLPTTTVSDSGATFHCVVSNGTQPDATSQTATLTVNPISTTTDFQASAGTITKGQGVTFTYLFNPAGTATFGPQGGTAVPVNPGEATTVYPKFTTTYVLTVTVGGVSTPTLKTVLVKTYTPKFLYVLNKDDNNIWQYPANVNSPRASSGGSENYDEGGTDATQALVGSALDLKQGTGASPFHIAATWDERFVFVANNGDATISAYAVDTTSGNLMPVAGSPFALPAGYTKPWCSAPDPAGVRLYVACAEGLAVLGIDGTSGALSAAPALGYTIPGRVQGDLIMHPSGKYLYVADAGHSVIKAFTIDSVTGALAPNGSDMAVTFQSGFNPTTNLMVQNPSNLVFDRASSVVITRSTDPLVFQHGTTYVDTNGAYDSYQVDPFTGTLTHLATSQGPLQYNSFFLVNGAVEADHGLVYTAMYGVDHLVDTYKDIFSGFYGPHSSELNLDLNPGSATFGAATGYYLDPTYNFAGPHSLSGFESDGYEHGASSLVQDRSGRIFVPLMGYGSGTKLIAFGSNAQGSKAYMGSGTGFKFLATGAKPVHGIFLGTLN